MILDAALTPADIALLPQRDLAATTCVVFDVLRATSSMVTALANGAAEIHPVRTIEEALELKARMPHAVLGGERHGERIDGFDVGNSPFEYRHLAGRTIISTTTNGTVALRAVEHAGRVLVGALLNLDALAHAVQQDERVLLVCAGTFEECALEAVYAAGLLISRLGAADLTDAARLTWAAAKLFPEPIDALRASRNGRALLVKGRGEEVDWCARAGLYSTVGEMKASAIRALST